MPVVSVAASCGQAGEGPDVPQIRIGSGLAAAFLELDQYLFGHRLERIENTRALVGDSFKHRLAFAHEFFF